MTKEEKLKEQEKIWLKEKKLKKLIVLEDGETFCELNDEVRVVIVSEECADRMNSGSKYYSLEDDWYEQQERIKIGLPPVETGCEEGLLTTNPIYREYTVEEYGENRFNNGEVLGDLTEYTN